MSDNTECMQQMSIQNGHQLMFAQIDKLEKQHKSKEMRIKRLVESMKTFEPKPNGKGNGEYNQLASPNNKKTSLEQFVDEMRSETGVAIRHLFKNQGYENQEKYNKLPDISTRSLNENHHCSLNEKLANSRRSLDCVNAEFDSLKIAEIQSIISQNTHKKQQSIDGLKENDDTTLDEMKTECDELKKQNEEYKQEIIKMQSKLNESMSSWQHNVDILQEKYEKHLDSVIAECNALKQQNKECLCKIAGMQSKINENAHKQQSIDERNKVIEHSKNALDEMRRESKLQLIKMRDSINILTIKNKEYQQSIKEYERRSDEEQRDSKQIENQLKQQLIEKNEKIKEYKQMINQMQQKYDESTANESAGTADESDIAYLRSVLDQMDRMKRDNKNKTEKIITMNTGMMMATNEHSELEQKMIELETENESLKQSVIALQKNITTRHRNLMELMDENKILQNRAKHEQFDIDSLNKIFKQIKDKHESDINDLKETIALQGEQSSSEQLESDQCHQERVDNLMKRFSEQIGLFESESKSLKQHIKMLNAQIEHQQQKINSFDATSENSNALSEEQIDGCQIIDNNGQRIDEIVALEKKKQMRQVYPVRSTVSAFDGSGKPKHRVDKDIGAQNKMKILKNSVLALEQKFMSFEKYSDVITIIGKNEDYKDRSMLVTKECITIGTERFDYRNIWEIIECVEYGNKLWIMLTSYGAVNIVSSDRKTRDEIICFIRSNPLFEASGIGLLS